MPHDVRFLKETIEKHRVRLIDTSKRNNLISFNHSETSRQHTRVIDELPDFLFSQLVDGKTFTILGLPEQNDIPKDEQSKNFKYAYEQAKLTDEAYVTAVTELDQEADTAVDALRIIDRDLRDRVRIQLGLPPLPNLKTLSNSDIARGCGLNPSYELPEPDASDYSASGKHADKFIQTLLRNDELERKLGGLYAYIRNDIEETGVNTLYAAFGFLQWYESNAVSKPCFSPLLLLQLEVEKKQSDKGYIYTVQATGEEPRINISLAARLEKDFGIKLPDFDGDAQAESYFKQVTSLLTKANIPQKDKWRVRRFVTLARLKFARLVMYNDLEASTWPANAQLQNNNVLGALFSGNSAGTNGHAPDYEVDKEDVDRDVPLLVTPADASQHSAILDVMRGRNLAIDGPPGTGKSQTITNIIANALAHGKTVLFVAEKMAALNVVHDRLRGAGLQHYCLELHSTKAKKTEILHSIAERVTRKPKRAEGRLDEKIADFKRQREFISDYISTLNTVFKYDRTIHDFLWAAQNRRDRVVGLGIDLKQFQIPYSDAELSESELKGYIDQINVLADSAAAHRPDSSTFSNWGWLTVESLDPFAQDDLFNQLDGIKGSVIGFKNRLDSFAAAYGHEPVYEQSLLSEYCGGYTPATADIDETDQQILADISGLHDLKQAVAFLDSVLAAKQLISSLSGFSQPQSAAGKVDDLQQLSELANLLQVQDFTSEEIGKRISDERTACKAWDTWSIQASKILRKGVDLLTVEDVAIAGDLVVLASQASPEMILARNSSIVDPSSQNALSSGLARQNALKEMQLALRDIDLSLLKPPSTLRRQATLIEQKGFFSFLDSEYRTARKDFRLADRLKRKATNTDIAKILRAAAEIGDAIEDLRNDASLSRACGPLFSAENSDFELFVAVNGWAGKVRQLLPATDEGRLKVREELLSGSPERINELKEFAEPAQSFRVATTVEHSHEDKSQNFHAYMKNMVTRIGGLENVREGLSLHGTTLSTWAKIKSQISTLWEIAKLEQAIASNSFAQRIYGERLAGASTPMRFPEKTRSFLIRFSEISVLSSSLAALASSDFTQNWRRFTADFSDLSKSYQECIASVEKIKTYDQLRHLRQKPLDALTVALTKMCADREGLRDRVTYLTALTLVKAGPAKHILSAFEASGAPLSKLSALFEAAIYSSIAREIYQRNPLLTRSSGLALEQARVRLATLDSEIAILKKADLNRLLDAAQVNSGIGTGPKSLWTEGPLIYNEITKQRRHIATRDLMKRAGASIQKIKPCFLMSPMTVAQFLPAGTIRFDLLVIDEASQMRPEDALGGIARADQVVIVGDPKQLPPTSFFDQTRADEEEIGSDETSDAIMDVASTAFRPKRMLTRHYRSKHESLIAFSNRHFYDSKLVVFPSPHHNPDERGVKLEYVGGAYAASANLTEVTEIVRGAVNYMGRFPERSLGIATMNQTQKELVDAEMDRVFLENPTAAAYKARWDNTLEPFFVKNLESVQGDERDGIFVSTVYGPDANGNVMQRFGPINRAGGYRRLNVLFSRARMNMVVYTSLHPEDIKINADSSDGVRAFRGFLAYAATGMLDEGVAPEAATESDFETCVKDRLEAMGYEVVPQVGVAGYRIDLGIKHRSFTGGYICGIECDGAAYHSSKSARERDIIRQKILEGLGWNIYRIWSTDWFSNPEAQIEKLREYLGDRVAQSKAMIVPEVHTVPSVRGTAATISSPLEDIRETLPAPSNDEPASGKIMIGDRVTYEMVKPNGSTELRSVELVSGQSDPSAGTIGQFSAIGKALLSSKVGDEIEVLLPIGEVSITVIDVQGTLIADRSGTDG